MEIFHIKGTDIDASRIAIGCMGIADKTHNEIVSHINTCLESGYNFFDHADIYGGGKCEENFGKVLKEQPSLREKIYLQSKCCIRNGYYDFSKEYILSSVDGILKRLNTDYLDTLLLHRPDTLMEPEEVAEAFSKLHLAGKVRYFGVSNHNPMQIELIKKYTHKKIVINQLQFSITNSTMIDAGLNVNMGDNPAVNRDGSVLEYCRLNDITIQPWSPFRYGFFEGIFVDNDKFNELNNVLDKYAKKYNISKNAVAIAWILRHPAKMQPIIGTSNKNRIADIAKATNISLSREEWYEIYRSAGHRIP